MTDSDRDLDLLVVGELNPDVIVLGAPERPAFGQAETIVDRISMTVGSSSAIAACGAARLGLRVGFVGIVGDDEFGRFMLRTLGERGIDVSGCIVDPVRTTGASVILGRGGDRAILTAVGAIEALRAEDVPAGALSRARHVHVGSLYLQTALRSRVGALLAAARRGGATTSIDPNWDPSGRWDPLDDVLAATDVCLLNLAEATALTGESDPERAARVLSGDEGRAVVVKLGSDGALAVRGDEVSHVAAPSMHVVDTTGAGDSFDAGFIAGWSSGWTLDRSLDLAVTCGSASTSCAGGVDGQPTFDQARVLVEANGRSLPDRIGRLT